MKTAGIIIVLIIFAVFNYVVEASDYYEEDQLLFDSTTSIEGQHFTVAFYLVRILMVNFDIN